MKRSVLLRCCVGRGVVAWRRTGRFRSRTLMSVAIVPRSALAAGASILPPAEPGLAAGSLPCQNGDVTRGAGQNEPGATTKPETGCAPKGGRINGAAVLESDGEVCAVAIAGSMIARATAGKTLRRATYGIVGATDETPHASRSAAIVPFLYASFISTRENSARTLMQLGCCMADAE